MLQMLLFLKFLFFHFLFNELENTIDTGYCRRYPNRQSLFAGLFAEKLFLFDVDRIGGGGGGGGSGGGGGERRQVFDGVVLVVAAGHVVGAR